jgi:putative Mg2+ transporter-C (MgtC) family protein
MEISKGLYMAHSSWFWESWRVLWPGPGIDLVLALTAIFCGLIVGGERQRREKPAGLRTLTMVCLGAAVFTMASFAFTTTTGDSGRVAAQIVTGIGFLGAGVILHGRRVVSGMTTAAIIWMTAAIGMTVGAGYVVASVGLSVLVRLLMVAIFLYETRWHPDLQDFCVVLDFAPRGGVTRVRLERVLVDYNLVGASTEWSDPSPETGRLTLNARMARIHLYELLTELVDVPEVASVQKTSCAVHQPAGNTS